MHTATTTDRKRTWWNQVASEMVHRLSSMSEPWEADAPTNFGATPRRSSGPCSNPRSERPYERRGPQGIHEASSVQPSDSDAFSDVSQPGSPTCGRCSPEAESARASSPCGGRGLVGASGGDLGALCRAKLKRHSALAWEGLGGLRWLASQECASKGAGQQGRVAAGFVCPSLVKQILGRNGQRATPRPARHRRRTARRRR